MTIWEASVLDYFNVVLDYNGGYNPQQMGAEYAKQIKKILPGYEALIDSYITEIIPDNDFYQVMLQRAKDLKPKVNQDYLDEIEGMAGQFSGGDGTPRRLQPVSRGRYRLCLEPREHRRLWAGAVGIRRRDRLPPGYEWGWS